MGRILVGTTSWTDKTLIACGRFYPPDVTSPEARLRYYASRFPLVEVDSSYYGLPAERNAHLWAERTPAGFVFDVKAFRLFTRHRTPRSALPADLREAVSPDPKAQVYYDDVPAEVRDAVWERFRSALEPLRAAGKLGVVLLQFPPWFGYGAESMAHLEACAQRLAPLDVAVEFRNRSWLTERHRREVLAFERERDLVHVAVDEPQLGGDTVPQVWEATRRELAVVRLHGRNAGTWRRKDLPSAAERFDYLYDEDELAALAEPIQALSERVGAVHVLFNNCHQDKAQRNAAELVDLLARRGAAANR